MICPISRFCLFIFALCACLAAGQTMALESTDRQSIQEGLASYYSRAFDGKETAGGETFSNEEMVAAHPTYPLGTIVLVKNLELEDPPSVVLRIADRGPSVRNQKDGVIIDVSQAAARKLDMKKDGRVKVRVRVLRWGEDEKKPLAEDTVPARKRTKRASR